MKKLLIISASISAIGLLGYSNGAFAQETFGQRWAVVSSNGNIVRGDGALSVKRNKAGDYTVKFDSNVSDCAYVASLGSTTTGSTPTGFAVTGSDANNQRVHVVTRNEKGSKSDRPFHLAVICQQPPT